MKATIYPSYAFRDHDPMIDAYWNLERDSGMKRNAICGESRVAKSTVNNWGKKTKRPQSATLMAQARAAGATGMQFNRAGKPYFTTK